MQPLLLVAMCLVERSLQRKKGMNNEEKSPLYSSINTSHVAQLMLVKIPQTS